MLTQQEFVEGCLAQYEEIYLQPGNPEDGEWHECHYPKPKCLGGTETILLLKEHHAVQGVLQSEEYQHPCIYGWEKVHLSGELLERFTYWRSELSRMAVAVTNSISPELRQKRAAKASRAALKWRAQQSPDFLRAIAVKAAAAAAKVLTPEIRKINGSKGGSKAQAIRKPEQQKEWASKGAKKQHSTRVKCLVTGYISTPCGLSHYQRHRGIDTALRERIEG